MQLQIKNRLGFSRPFYEGKTGLSSDRGRHFRQGGGKWAKKQIHMILMNQRIVVADYLCCRAIVVQDDELYWMTEQSPIIIDRLLPEQIALLHGGPICRVAPCAGQRGSNGNGKLTTERRAGRWVLCARAQCCEDHN